MRFSRIFLFVFIFLWTGVFPLLRLYAADETSRSAESDAKIPAPPSQIAPGAPVFANGIAAFRKGDFKRAQAEFAQLLSRDPTQTILLNDLAISVANQGQLGLSLGLWRKALAFSPDFGPAVRGIRWAEGKLQHHEIPHEVELWESFHTEFLNAMSIDRFLFATAVTLFGAGFLWFRHLGRRRRAFLDDQPVPGFPVVAFFLTVLFLISSSLTLSKFYDGMIQRATVIVAKVEVRSSPDPEGTALFDLFEGLEVLVRQSVGDWIQVTYPGGSTGWVPKTALYSNQ